MLGRLNLAHASVSGPLSFVGQVEQELATLSDLEATTLRNRLLETMRVIWVDVGLNHPSFKQLALELSEKGRCRAGHHDAVRGSIWPAARPRW